MRTVIYFLSAALVIGLAYWAYQQNFQTQKALKRVSALHTEIAATREALSVLRAEWAYLNRPDRLRDLVDLNFSELQLVPMNPNHFGAIDEVAFPSVPSLAIVEGLVVSASDRKSVV